MANTEIKLVIRSLPFSQMVVLTGTSEALQQLAAVLRTKDYQRIQKFLDEYLPNAQFEEANTGSVYTQYNLEKPYILAFPGEALAPIASRLEEFGLEDDYSQAAVSGLGLLHPDTSKNDLILVKLDKAPVLKNDYPPDADGTLLEALLYHPLASLEQYQQAWSTLEEWSHSPKSRVTHTASLLIGGEAKDDLEPTEAFKSLLQDSDSYRVIAFF